jgi:nucleoid DNA-binding protein
VPLTQTQLASAVADRAGLSNTDAKRALAALEEVLSVTQFRHAGVIEVQHRGEERTNERSRRDIATKGRVGVLGV